MPQEKTPGIHTGGRDRTRETDLKTFTRRRAGPWPEARAGARGEDDEDELLPWDGAFDDLSRRSFECEVDEGVADTELALDGPRKLSEVAERTRVPVAGTEEGNEHEHHPLHDCLASIGLNEHPWCAEHLFRGVDGATSSLRSAEGT
jgi:hypothetical protein